MFCLRDGEWRLTAVVSHEELKITSRNAAVSTFCTKKSCITNTYLYLAFPRSFLYVGLLKGPDIQLLNNMTTICLVSAQLKNLNVQ